MERGIIKRLSLCSISTLLAIGGWGQIYEPEGLNIPGAWNSWTNPPTNNLALASSTQVTNGRVIKIITGTTRWQTIISVAASGGDVVGGTYAWLFTSGPVGNPWNNKWAGVNVTLNTLQTYSYNSGSDNSVTVTNGRWYTINWKDVGYQSTQGIFMETTAPPVELSSLSFSPNSDINPWETVTVTLTTNNPPCPEERIFLRYTTDNWSSSTLVLFSFSGTTGTAEIPAYSAGTTVWFYAYSTTLDADSIGNNHDMVSIRVINNSGSNYSYTVITPTTYTTAQNGNFSSSSTWVGGNVPPSGSALSINHQLTLDQNYIASSITIGSSGHLIFLGNQVLTIEGNGTWTNNGDFTGGEGTVVLKSNVSTGGSSISEFNNVTVAGVNVSFTYIKSRINGILNITTGSVLNAPELRNGSTLKYSQGDNYVRVTEWNNPWHVVVANNTQLDLNIDAFGNDLTIRGNFTIEGGSSATMGATTRKLIVEGDLFLNGTLSLSSSAGGDLYVKGNWNRTGTFNPNGRLVLFNGVSPQTFTGHTTFDFITVNTSSTLALNDGISVNSAFEVNGTLNLGTQIVDGDGVFTVSNGATLVIGDLNGINSSVNTGNIRVKGSRNYNNEATYHYVGNGNQVSGTGLPTSPGAKTIIIELSYPDNTFVFNTPSAVSISASGNLEIRRGILIEAASPTDGRHVEGAGNLTMTGGEYRLLRVAKTIDVPRLTGDYNLTGGKIVLAANGGQKLRAGKNYYMLEFSGTDTAFVGTTSSIGSVIIANSKVVDVGSSTFGGTGTNLTMTGGKLRISKVTGTLPEMTGTYNLTGGTIEFYGTSATQTQTIRSGVTYYNVEINAAAANLTSGNVAILGGSNFAINGTLTINEPACFQIGTTSSSYVSGTGNFVLQSGAAIRLGQGVQSGTLSGNIRTTNKTLSSQATYILYGNANQTIDDPFPTLVENLHITKSGGNVTLNKNLQIQNTLKLSQGKIIGGIYTITLLNSNPTAIEGGSNASYFIGNLIRSIAQTTEGKSTSYLFPLGAPNSYNPVIVEFVMLPLTSGTLSASFISTLDPNYFVSLPIYDGMQEVNNASEKGYWVLTPNNLADYTYNITISGQDFNIMPPEYYTNANGLRVMFRDNFNSPWKFLGDHGGGSYNPLTVSRNNISGQFGIIAMGGLFSENPLPMQLLTFTARACEHGVLIQWETFSEKNFSHFNLLRSSDMVYFYETAKIMAAGNSNLFNRYQVYDSNPLPGINYYKLQCIDFDGNMIKTEITNVTIYNDESVYCLQGELYIDFKQPYSGELTYRIVDLSGITRRQDKISLLKTPTITINISAMESSIFILQLQRETLTSTHKIVLQK